jgi:hypothetical protein
MAEPLGMKTGDLRVGPPPVGSMVSLIAVLVFTGSEGYKRRAGRYLVETHRRAYTD